ncbi:MAG: hypothetical protein U1E05_21590 [Patescibacteria group bacterium]|nr:hypothetical protein [Patescibacteria group bacterium]
MDAIRELMALTARLEQAEAQAKAITAQEADDDCDCEYCMDLRAMLEGIDNALHFAADAIEAERSDRKVGEN